MYKNKDVKNTSQQCKNIFTQYHGVRSFEQKVCVFLKENFFRY